MCELVRDRVSVLHCVTERNADSVSVGLGHALSVVFYLVDGINVVHRVTVRHALRIAVCIGHALSITDDLVDAV